MRRGFIDVEFAYMIVILILFIAFVTLTPVVEKFYSAIYPLYTQQATKNNADLTIFSLKWMFIILIIGLTIWRFAANFRRQEVEEVYRQ